MSTPETKPMINDKTREEIDERLREFDQVEDSLEKAAAEIRDMLDPIASSEARVRDMRDAYLESCGVEYAGRCETCEKLLLAGDKGSHPYEDEFDMVFCEEHSMTYGDLRRHWTDESLGHEVEDPERQKDVLAMIEAHLAGGGSLDDKCGVFELEASYR